MGVTTGAIVLNVLYALRGSFELDIDFTSLIVAERDILASTDSDRHKLNSLGDIYYDCSLGILARSEELLNLATRNIQPKGDTAIDESFDLFLQGWMQKSVSVNFLNEYLQPRERKNYSRENVEVTEISHVEAVAAYAVEDIVAETLKIAHEENVREWEECLLEIMSLWGCDRYTFSQLVSLSNLSAGRVFLALFLSDRLNLSQDGNFYGEIEIGV